MDHPPDPRHEDDTVDNAGDDNAAEDAPGAQRDDATLALPYGYESDPLADFWESPAIPLRLPDEPGAQAPADPHRPSQGSPRRERDWGHRRVLAAFGLAVAVVAVAGLSLGLVSGNPDGDARAGSAPVRNGETGDEARRGRQDTPPAVTQARAVDSLLDRSTSARDGVVAAVVHTKRCARIPRNVRDLRAAARQREQLATRLRRLDVGAMPHGKEIAATLRHAWTASARADREFAAWAQRVGRPGGCPDGTAATGPHYRKAVEASAVASNAKARFVRLWDPVAAMADLPKRSEDEI